MLRKFTFYLKSSQFQHMTPHVHASKHRSDSIYASCAAFILPNFFLLSNVSVASQSKNDMSDKAQLDLHVQKEVDSIKEIKSPRILLAIPFREYLVAPTEEDFRRDACKYDLKEKNVEADLVGLIGKSHLKAYQKSLGWTNAIVEIDYSDLKGNHHTLTFEQDYPGHDRINGFFDGRPITADSSFIKNIYRIVLNLETNNACDPFISPYQ